MNLPSAFEEKMRGLLQEEFDEYIACYEEPRYYGLRVNTAKITVEEFERICPFEITPIPWIENGFYYDGENVAPAKHPYYFAGLYYLQEPSAMTPASRLPVEPGDKVLDVCAAPGGKATELGARLKGQGILVANDISSSRAKGLLKNMEVFGIGNMLVLSEEPGRLEQYFPEYFDRENERIIEHLREACPEFQILKISPYSGFCQGMPQCAKNNDPELAKTVRIFPHRMKGEGHYLALLRKGEAQKKAPEELRKKNTRKMPEELEQFFRDVSWNLETQRLDIRFLRTGLLLGELKKNRFEPSQALAMCLKKSEYAHCIDLPAEDERVRRYLKGETLELADMTLPISKGWCLVCVDGYPLGWGKLAGGALKNKYLPGWRLC